MPYCLSDVGGVPSLACGGRLLLAELTRGAVTVRTITDLEAR